MWMPNMQNTREALCFPILRGIGTALDAGEMWGNVVWPPPNLHEVDTRQAEHRLFGCDLLMILYASHRSQMP